MFLLKPVFISQNKLMTVKIKNKHKYNMLVNIMATKVRQQLHIILDRIATSYYKNYHETLNHLVLLKPTSK